MGSALSGFFIDTDEQHIPKTFGGFIQIMSLLIAYGFILSKSSAMISDGSELLLLIPSLAGIVGSVVLPVLGAVPDGAIVLFSGLGPDAATQLSVGVGALAGSTIMLLTIPWALCIYMGRVELDAAGVANYKSKSPKKGFNLFHEGVTPRPSIAVNGKIMIVTAISYIIIQASSFAVHCDLAVEHDCNPAGQHWVAFVALLFCIAFFIGYLVYNVKHANDEDKEDFVQEVKKQAIESHIISLSVAFEKDLGGAPSSKDHLLGSEDGEKKFDATLKSFFRRYDRNGDGVIDRWELKSLLADVNESLPEDKFNQLLKAMDTDNSGVIEFGEFCAAMRDFVKRKNSHPHESYVEPARSALSGINVQSPAVAKHGASTNVEAHDEEEEEEEEEDVPEDLAHLPPDKQKMRILLRAGWMMGLGTAITLIFSDPMVDVLSTLGDHLNISPFYIAFVLAPIASNASELIASINYATKRTKKTITISLAALEGAACMNNTFCLAIFLALIFLLKLPWNFSAETISILFVELILFAYTFKPTYKVFDTFVILSVYPASLFLVWFLENVIKLN